MSINIFENLVSDKENFMWKSTWVTVCTFCSSSWRYCSRRTVFTAGLASLILVCSRIAVITILYICLIKGSSNTRILLNWWWSRWVGLFLIDGWCWKSIIAKTYAMNEEVTLLMWNMPFEWLWGVFHRKDILVLQTDSCYQKLRLLNIIKQSNNMTDSQTGIINKSPRCLPWTQQ